MARWSSEFRTEAVRDLAKLGRDVRRRIIVKLEWLAENFEGIMPPLLSGEFADFYKLRVGDTAPPPF